MLIRNALVALNQANATGNYTVLRDLGTPAFQRVNDSARLGLIFAELRSKGADFSPVFFIGPTLSQPASIDQYGILRLNGYIPTRPDRIIFDLSFQQVEGKWGLIGMIVDLRPAPDAMADASGQPPQAQAAPAANNASPAKPASSTGKKGEGDKSGSGKTLTHKKSETR